MKPIRIKYIGFWKSFDPHTYIITKMLSKHYSIEISDDPEYIICSCFGDPYEYCSYPQVRIMLVEENYTPDFNFIDYAICHYPISFLDRCFYWPGCCMPFEHAVALEQNRAYNESFLSDKEYFACFIASHESEYRIRGSFFKELSKYKRIESPGSYLNNMSDGKVVSWLNDSKTDFQKKCKFSLCFESTKHEGFITEKITDAFYSGSIPIYYGSSTIKEIFNPKAFINVSDYDSIEDAIAYIKLLDNNDELFLEMINQPILKNSSFVSNTYKHMEEFLVRIFDQPIDSAFRRSRVYWPKYHEDYLLALKKKGLTDYSTKILLKELARRTGKKLKDGSFSALR